MNTQMLMYLMIGCGVILFAIMVAFVIMQKNNKDRKHYK